MQKAHPSHRVPASPAIAPASSLPTLFTRFGSHRTYVTLTTPPTATCALFRAGIRSQNKLHPGRSYLLHFVKGALSHLFVLQPSRIISRRTVPPGRFVTRHSQLSVVHLTSSTKANILRLEAFLQVHQPPSCLSPVSASCSGGSSRSSP